MGLRLAEGVPLTRLERVAGRPWREVVDESALARLGDGGFLDVRDGRLVATAAGRQRLDALLVSLLP
jgi:coproporphyrinogen III oxidase-like Fe-S oxidoreductase